MPFSHDRSIGLDALSARQQRLVERHLPLVRHTLCKVPALNSPRSGRDPRDLRQEGGLALVDAIRSHEPHRHGPFAPYAMARIHLAISRHVHEDESLIRIPWITQRRRDARSGDRHHPHPSSRLEQSGSVTVGDALRRRINAAIASELCESVRNAGTDAERRIIQACASQRWWIPDLDCRTPLRRLAAAHGCTPGRIARLESRFYRRVAARLAKDKNYAELVQLSRTAPDGLQHRLNADQIHRSMALSSGD